MIKTLTLGKRILESNIKRPSFPYKLTYIITDKCNAKCKNCNIWEKNTKDELSLEEINQFFKKSNNFSWINLAGGEPFLRKDLYEIILSIKRNCKSLYLLDFPTNGFLTDHIIKTVKKVKKLNFNKLVITVSLDAPKDLHDYMRGLKGCFNNAIKTFKLLRQLKVECYLGLTIFNSNAGKFSETFKEVKKEIPSITYKDFHINIVHSSEHCYAINIKKENQKILKELKSIRNIKKVSLNPISIIEHKYLKLAEQYLRTNKTPLPCKALTSSCFINSTGDVYPCTIFNKKLGNIRDYNYDLKKIWNSKTTKKVSKEITKGKCPNCWTPCEAYQSILGNLPKLL
jgi:MoaA/NifB/PqqE/SkfB family radical SAM enzyme